MNTTLQPDLLRQRIAETITWCRIHGSLADPKGSLRTPDLRPSNWAQVSDHWGNLDYDWGSQNNKESATLAVSALADKRAALLQTENHAYSKSSLDLAGGRLLIAAPEDSDQCGLSSGESAHFIDDLDVPAWDAWVCFVHEERFSAQVDAASAYGFNSRPAASYLLCYIPREFMPLVEQGIMVNPVECFFWAAEYKRRGYDTPTLRWLESEGLLT